MKKIAAILMIVGSATAVSAVGANAEEPAGSAITTTTIAATTTTIGATTTSLAVTPPVATTTTVTLAPSLPATGSNGTSTMAIAGVLLAAGAGLFGVARMRRRQATTI